MKYIILLLALVVGFAASLTSFKSESKTQVPSEKYIAIEGQTTDGKSTLQLGSLQFVTVTPTQAQTTLTLTPTQTPSTCSSKIAVDLLLDTSGSMDDVSSSSGKKKIDELKSAIDSFLKHLNDEDIIAAQSLNNTGIKAPPIRISPDKYANNKQALQTAINQIWPEGETPMKDGFSRAALTLSEIKKNWPDYTRVLIFVSDGIPDVGKAVPDESQNPLQAANGLKQDGVRIVSIGLDLHQISDYYKTQQNRLTISLQELVDYALNLMKNIASDPKDKNFRDSTAHNLEAVYSDIAKDICR